MNNKISKARAPHRVHILSWVLTLDSKGYIPCHYRSCSFMAMTLEEMVTHFHYSGCSNEFRFTCNICNLSTDLDLKLLFHNIYIHSYNATTEEQRELSTYLSVKKEVTPNLRRGWKAYLEHKGYLKCFNRACLYVPASVEDMEEHYMHQCKDTFWSCLTCQCPVCGGRFENTTRMKSHADDCHVYNSDEKVRLFKEEHPAEGLAPDWAKVVLAEKQASCPVPDCKFVSNNVALLSKHYKACMGHKEVGFMVCALCQSWLLNAEKLQEHMRCLHKGEEIPVEAQSVCSKESQAQNERTEHQGVTTETDDGESLTTLFGRACKNYPSKRSKEVSSPSLPLALNSDIRPSATSIMTSKKNKGIDCTSNNISAIQFSETNNILGDRQFIFHEEGSISLEDRRNKNMAKIRNLKIKEKGSLPNDHKPQPTSLEEVVSILEKEKTTPSLPVQVKVNTKEFSVTVDIPTQGTSHSSTWGPFPENTEALIKVLREESFKTLKIMSSKCVTRCDTNNAFNPYEEPLLPVKLSVKNNSVKPSRGEDKDVLNPLSEPVYESTLNKNTDIKVTDSSPSSPFSISEEVKLLKEEPNEEPVKTESCSDDFITSKSVVKPILQKSFCNKKSPNLGSIRSKRSKSLPLNIGNDVTNDEIDNIFLGFTTEEQTHSKYMTFIEQYKKITSSNEKISTRRTRSKSLCNFNHENTIELPLEDNDNMSQSFDFTIEDNDSSSSESFKDEEENYFTNEKPTCLEENIDTGENVTEKRVYINDANKGLYYSQEDLSFSDVVSDPLNIPSNRDSERDTGDEDGSFEDDHSVASFTDSHNESIINDAQDSSPVGDSPYGSLKLFCDDSDNSDKYDKDNMYEESTEEVLMKYRENLKYSTNTSALNFINENPGLLNNNKTGRPLTLYEKSQNIHKIYGKKKCIDSDDTEKVVSDSGGSESSEVIIDKKINPETLLTLVNSTTKSNETLEQFTNNQPKKRGRPKKSVSIEGSPNKIAHETPEVKLNVSDSEVELRSPSGPRRRGRSKSSLSATNNTSISSLESSLPLGANETPEVKLNVSDSKVESRSLSGPRRRGRSKSSLSDTNNTSISSLESSLPLGVHETPEVKLNVSDSEVESRSPSGPRRRGRSKGSLSATNNTSISSLESSLPLGAHETPEVKLNVSDSEVKSRSPSGPRRRGRSKSSLSDTNNTSISSLESSLPLGAHETPEVKLKVSDSKVEFRSPSGPRRRGRSKGSLSATNNTSISSLESSLPLGAHETPEVKLNVSDSEVESRSPSGPRRRGRSKSSLSDTNNSSLESSLPLGAHETPEVKLNVSDSKVEFRSPSGPRRRGRSKSSLSDTNNTSISSLESSLPLGAHETPEVKLNVSDSEVESRSPSGPRRRGRSKGSLSSTNNTSISSLESSLPLGDQDKTELKDNSKGNFGIARPKRLRIPNKRFSSDNGETENSPTKFTDNNFKTNGITIHKTKLQKEISGEGKSNLLSKTRGRPRRSFSISNGEIEATTASEVLFQTENTAEDTIESPKKDARLKKSICKENGQVDNTIDIEILTPVANGKTKENTSLVTTITTIPEEQEKASTVEAAKKRGRPKKSPSNVCEQQNLVAPSPMLDTIISQEKIFVNNNATPAPDHELQTEDTVKENHVESSKGRGRCKKRVCKERQESKNISLLENINSQEKIFVETEANIAPEMFPKENNIQAPKKRGRPKKSISIECEQSGNVSTLVSSTSSLKNIIPCEDKSLETEGAVSKNQFQAEIPIMANTIEVSTRQRRAKKSISTEREQSKNISTLVGSSSSMGNVISQGKISSDADTTSAPENEFQKENDTEVPKKRGRPQKIISNECEHSDDALTLVGSMSSLENIISQEKPSEVWKNEIQKGINSEVPKKRGRPKRSISNEHTQLENTASLGNIISEKKISAESKITTAQECQLQEEAIEEPKKRGRPKKSISKPSEQSENTSLENTISHRKTSVESKVSTAQENQFQEENTIEVSKKRGRQPRKSITKDCEQSESEQSENTSLLMESTSSLENTISHRKTSVESEVSTDQENQFQEEKTIEVSKKRGRQPRKSITKDCEQSENTSLLMESTSYLENTISHRKTSVESEVSTAQENQFQEDKTIEVSKKRGRPPRKSITTDCEQSKNTSLQMESTSSLENTISHRKTSVESEVITVQEEKTIKVSKKQGRQPRKSISKDCEQSETTSLLMESTSSLENTISHRKTSVESIISTAQENQLKKEQTIEVPKKRGRPKKSISIEIGSPATFTLEKATLVAGNEKVLKSKLLQTSYTTEQVQLGDQEHLKTLLEPMIVRRTRNNNSHESNQSVNVSGIKMSPTESGVHMPSLNLSTDDVREESNQLLEPKKIGGPKKSLPGGIELSANKSRSKEFTFDLVDNECHGDNTIKASDKPTPDNKLHNITEDSSGFEASISDLSPSSKEKVGKMVIANLIQAAEQGDIPSILKHTEQLRQIKSLSADYNNQAPDSGLNSIEVNNIKTEVKEDLNSVLVPKKRGRQKKSLLNEIDPSSSERALISANQVLRHDFQLLKKRGKPKMSISNESNQSNSSTSELKGLPLLDTDGIGTSENLQTECQIGVKSIAEPKKLGRPKKCFVKELDTLTSENVKPNNQDDEIGQVKSRLVSMEEERPTTSRSDISSQSDKSTCVLKDTSFSCTGGDVASENMLQTDIQEVIIPTLEPKKRGRPKTIKSNVNNLLDNSTLELKNITFPDKNDTVASENILQAEFLESISPIVEPKKRGRQKKSLIQSSQSSPIHDIHNIDSVLSTSKETPGEMKPNLLPRKRGRPKRVDLTPDSRAVSTSGLNSSDNDDHYILAKKRRLSSIKSDTESSPTVDDSSGSSALNISLQSKEHSILTVHNSLEEHITPQPKKRGRPRKSFLQPSIPIKEEINISSDEEYVAKKSCRRSIKLDSLPTQEELDKEVKCAVCEETMTYLQFKQFHLLKHNFMAWIDGEDPLPLDDIDYMANFLTKGKRPYPEFLFTCERCNLTRKSSRGFLTHYQNCGREPPTPSGDVIDLAEGIESEHSGGEGDSETGPSDLQSPSRVWKVSELKSFLDNPEAYDSQDLPTDESGTPLTARQIRMRILSGRIDCSTKLKFPKKEVTCAICGESMSARDYQRKHLIKHNFMCWLVTEESLPLDDVDCMTNVLQRGKKKYPQVRFTCEVCKEEKRSAHGFLSHRQFCGRSEEEKQNLLETCKYCGRLMMPFSLMQHYRTSHRDEPIPGEEELVTNEPMRKAAAKCLDKIAGYVASDQESDVCVKEEEVDYEEEELERANAELKSFYKVTSRKAGKNLNLMWKKQQENGELLRCSISKCSFSCHAVKQMKFHFRECQHIFSSFSCQKCYYMNRNEEEMKEHVRRHVLEGSSSSEEESEETTMIPYLRVEETQLVHRHKMNFFKPAVGWTKNAHEANHSQEAVLPGYEVCWEEVADSRPFVPQEKKSIPLRYNSTSWKEMNIFEGKTSKGLKEGVGFAGGPVWGLAWCPSEGPQYLAVATQRSMETDFQIGSTYNGPGLIQIWGLGDITNSESVRFERLEFEYGICHEERGCWGLTWCPAGGETSSRLGLLAVATTSGTIPIYAVPRPDSLPLQRNRYYKLKPAVKLQLPSNEKWQCSAISWSKKKPHRTFVAGFVNGVIAVWDLESTSSLLRSSAGSLCAYKVFQGHNSFITGICLSPENENFIASSGFDRSVRFWDLRDTSSPQSETNRGLPTGIDWLRHWIMVASSFDVAYSQSNTTLGLSTIRGFMYQSTQVVSNINSTSWDVGCNDWLNALAASYDNGQLLVSFAIKLLQHKDRKKSSKVIVQCSLHQLPNEQVPEDCGATSSSQSEASSTHYHQSATKYGLEIKTDLTIQNSKYQYHKNDQLLENTEEGAIDRYPLTSVNRVSWSPNRQSFTYIASGCQAGFFTVTKLSFPYAEQNIIDSVS